MYLWMAHNLSYRFKSELILKIRLWIFLLVCTKTLLTQFFLVKITDTETLIMSKDHQETVIKINQSTGLSAHTWQLMASSALTLCTWTTNHLLMWFPISPLDGLHLGLLVLVLHLLTTSTSKEYMV